MFTKKTMDELERKTISGAKASAKYPVTLILDDVRSMHNVGSAFRTADAFAAEAIHLCGYTPTPPHREIHKTALGATETVPWRHYEKTIDAVNEARQKGYQIWAIEQTHNSIPLNDIVWGNTPLALIFGNEVTGVNEEILRVADGVIEIPQCGAKHSLNISVSLGVVLWELVRVIIK